MVHEKTNLREIGKKVCSINFDLIVMKKLEERSRLTGASVSNIVNFIVRQKVMTDSEFYRELAKYHYLKFQEYNFQKEQAMIQVHEK